MNGPRYAIFSDFASRQSYPALEAALPPMADVPHNTRSHKDLFQGDALFEQMLRDCPAWAYMFGKLRTAGFWHGVLDMLQPDLNEMHHNPYELPFYEFISEARNGSLLAATYPFLYLRMDIGYGVENYGLENGGSGPHIDFPQRVASVLWFFTDQSELKGGEFQLWSEGDMAALTGPVYPTPKGAFRAAKKADGSVIPTQLVREVPVAKNLAVAVLQDSRGWHSVNPVVWCREPRRAAYISLSCSMPIWKTR